MTIFKKKSFPLFLVIGGVNTLFGYTIFAAVIACGGHYVLASFISLCLGVIFNFHTTGKVVFGYAEKSLFVKFIGIYLLLYFLNIGLLRVNSSMVSNIYLNGLLVTFVVAMVAFFLNKYVVFRK